MSDAALTDINDPEYAETYAAEVYAISATGGFETVQEFNQVTLLTQTTITKFDVTNAVQIKMDRTWFNEQLGAYDTVTDSFEHDDFSITVADMQSLYVSANVISTGKFSTLYSDFTTYVNNYFGMAGGFETLFAAASEFKVASGATGEDAPQFLGDELGALINGADTIESGVAGVSVLTGSIALSNLKQLLRYAVDSNCFGNRTVGEDATAAGATNFGVNNKFLAGDMFWVPDAFTITLNLAIDSEAILPLNNQGSTYTQTISEGSALFTSTTTATVNLITRTARAPLLIKLIDA